MLFRSVSALILFNRFLNATFEVIVVIMIFPFLIVARFICTGFDTYKIATIYRQAKQRQPLANALSFYCLPFEKMMLRYSASFHYT